MKLRIKLMLAPVLAGAMLVVVLGASLWLLQSERARAEANHVQVMAAQAQVAAVQAGLAELHTRLYRTLTIIASLDDKAVQSMRGQHAQALGQIAAEATRQAEASADDEGLKQPLAAFVSQVAKYRKSSDGAVDLATVDPNTGIAAMQTAEADFKALGTTLAEVVGLVRARATAQTAAFEAASHRNAFLIGAAGLLAAALSIVFAWFAQARIVADIAEGSRAAARVAEGRLDVQPQSSSADEVGDLLRALGSMVARLRDSIHDVRQASESIRNASGEIATGNLDLSARTEQTASNLQQAASAMEELTATVRQSADSAQTANQLASSATQVAQRGGAVVAQVVSTMNEINTSSKKIADIIGTIDGIAFQTNILALNAAVEAARAGEQGRGFAVVAAEVRSLAQRSAEAAKEIKALIGTSVDKVETGARLVQDAGSTMSEIVASVQRVTDIIGEITAAANEQSAGISQVNTSVNQLDRMTQQNAALVEQSAAAAESLKDQARQLAGVVDAFRLEPAR